MKSKEQVKRIGELEKKVKELNNRLALIEGKFIMSSPNILPPPEQRIKIPQVPYEIGDPPLGLAPIITSQSKEKIHG